MATNSIRIDDHTKQAETVFDMSSDDFELACQKAIATRSPYPVPDYTTLIDQETGALMKKYADGRVEYVLD